MKEHFNLGDTVYIEGRFGAEACEVLGKMDEVYSVKHSYYTFDVHESKIFSTLEEAKIHEEKKLEESSKKYLEKMVTDEDFIKYCVEIAHAEAVNYPDLALARAIEKRYKQYFNEDINY